ncbi:hypothetical protein ACLKA6_000388 [Drosophila palustris]
MDAPIISIYDMLMKRYRQQKKDEQSHNKELLSGSAGRLNNSTRISANSITETKKPKLKTSITKIYGDSKDKQNTKMSSSVITASHLTKKHTGITMPSLTKKEVLNQLIERMSMSSKKPQERPVNNESSPVEDDSDGPIISIKKMKSKPKIWKPVPGSARSNSRRRLALSPRNTNSMGTPKLKREKLVKSKTVSNSKTVRTDTDNAVNVRPKRRVQANKSKISIMSKLEDRKIPSDENVVRYRL